MKTRIHMLTAALAAGALSLLGMSSSSLASTLGPASDYNVFYFQDATVSNSDAEGRIAVGGDFNSTNYGIATSLPNSGGTDTRLVVGGHWTVSNTGVHGGNAVVGNGVTGSPGFNGSGSLLTGEPIDFAQAYTELKSKSQNWSTAVTNGTTTYKSWETKLSGSDSTLNVFEVDGSQINGKQLSIDLASGAENSTVLVNVSGSSVSFTNAGMFINGSQAAGAGVNVLFNFYEATSLTLSGMQWQGTILAPDAHLQFANGHINGQVIAKSLNGSGEYHDYLFEGSLPDPGPSPVSAPSPAAVWVGLGLIGSLVMKRRRNAAAESKD